MDTFINRCNMVLEGKAISKGMILSLESYANEDFITSKIPINNFTDDLTGVGYEEVEVLIKGKLQSVKDNVKVNTMEDLTGILNQVVQNIGRIYNAIRTTKLNATELEEFLTNDKTKYVYGNNKQLIEIGNLRLLDFICNYSWAAEKVFNKYDSHFYRVLEMCMTAETDDDNIFKPFNLLKYIATKDLNNENLFLEGNLLFAEIPYMELIQPIKVNDLLTVLKNKDKVENVLLRFKANCVNTVWRNNITDRKTLDEYVNVYSNLLSLVDPYTSIDPLDGMKPLCMYIF